MRIGNCFTIGKYFFYLTDIFYFNAFKLKSTICNKVCDQHIRSGTVLNTDLLVLEILKGLDASTKLGCQAGTTGELYIKGDEDYGFDKLTAEAAPYKYVALAITAMQQGQVKYVIADNGPAKAIASKLNAQ